MEREGGIPIEPSDGAGGPQAPRLAGIAEPGFNESPVLGDEVALGSQRPEGPGGRDPQAIGVRDVLGESVHRYAADLARIYTAAAVLVVPALAISTVGALSIVGSILNIIAAASVMALVGAGPGLMPVRAAWRCGLRRAVRLFLVGLVIGLFMVPISVILLIAFSALGATGAPGPVVLVLVATVIVVAAWIYLRLSLAPAAVVLDGLGVNAALDQSRRLTRPRSTLLRLFAAILVTGVVSASSIGILMALLYAGLPTWLVYGIGGLLIAAVTPVYLIVNVVLYRRLAGAPAGEAWTFELGLTPAIRYRALAGSLAGLTVIGCLAWVGVRSQLASGVVALPAGAVPRGEIRFGTGMVLDECRVTGAATAFSTSDVATYVATFPRTIRAEDIVELEVLQDSVLIATIPQPGLANATCVGDTEGFSLPAAAYEFRFRMNDEVVARGSMTVR